MVEKAIDVEVKADLHLSFKTRKINFRYPMSHKPLVKKDKDKANWKYQNEALKDKAKSHNFSSAIQPLTQAPKKTCAIIMEVIWLLGSMLIKL